MALKPGTGAPSRSLLTPTTTTVPALRMAPKACPMCSFLTTPMLTIAESAPWPSVIGLDERVRFREVVVDPGGAEPRRPGLLARRRVDDHDVAGPGQGRALHGVHADAARADDEHHVAGAHVGSGGGRPEPRLHAQATTQIVLSGSDLSTLTREISS